MNNREDQKCSEREWENRETITINRIWNTNGDQYDEIYIYIMFREWKLIHTHIYIYVRELGIAI